MVTAILNAVAPNIQMTRGKNYRAFSDVGTRQSQELTVYPEGQTGVPDVPE